MLTLENAQRTNLKGTIDWFDIPIRAYSKSAGGPRAANENPRVVRHAADMLSARLRAKAAPCRNWSKQRYAYCSALSESGRRLSPCRHLAATAHWSTLPMRSPLPSDSLFHDAHTAMLMREHGIRQICTDTDFNSRSRKSSIPATFVASPREIGSSGLDLD